MPPKVFSTRMNKNSYKLGTQLNCKKAEYAQIFPSNNVVSNNSFDIIFFNGVLSRGQPKLVLYSQIINMNAKRSALATWKSPK